MRKDNELANFKEQDFTWKMLKQSNICPLNKKFSFEPFYSILNTINFKIITTTSDMNTLYYGTKNGLWVMALGDEIEEYYDCSCLIKKQSSKSDLFEANINWYFCFKTENTTKLKEIINLLNIARH